MINYFDKFTEQRRLSTLKDQINREVNEIVKKNYRELSSVGLFDPVQSHAIHGIHKVELEEVKAYLKAKGAKSFRQVKQGGDRFILCFNAQKMVNEWEDMDSFI